VSDDLIQHVRIDDCLKSYRTFFDHDWARRIGDLASGTVLDEAVFALGITWKSVANTHLMPWLLADSLAELLQSFLGGTEPTASRVIRAIHDQLLKSIGGSLPMRARKRLSAKINDLSASAILARDQAHRRLERRYNSNAIWQELLQTSEFRLSIWGSQRVCYGAVYHAFEDFARHCIAIASGEEDDWRPSGEVLEVARATYGNDFVDSILGDHALTVARLVRNALAHRGGRLTKELENINHGFGVEDGVVQIMACDTANLYHVLKSVWSAQRTLQEVPLITEGDIERLFESILGRIKDEDLPKKTVRVWVLACQRGRWKSVEELQKMPFTLLTDTRGVNFIEHTIAVTEGAYGLAKAQEAAYREMPYQIDYDRLLAGGLLHDVGNLLEFEPDGQGGYRRSRSGLCARHPISGTAIAYEAGLPDEVLNTIACHAKEGEGRPQVIETVLIHQADFATFEPPVMMERNTLIQ